MLFLNVDLKLENCKAPPPALSGFCLVMYPFTSRRPPSSLLYHSSAFRVPSNFQGYTSSPYFRVLQFSGLHHFIAFQGVAIFRATLFLSISGCCTFQSYTTFQHFRALQLQEYTTSQHFRCCNFWGNITISRQKSCCRKGLNSAWPRVESCEVKVCIKILLEQGTGVKANLWEMYL